MLDMMDCDKTQAHLEAARSKLDCAGVLLSENREGGAIVFSYLSMFHAANAIGLSEGKTFPPCSEWLTAFRESLAEKIGAQYCSDLAEAYRLRQIADYGTTAAMPAGCARTRFERAGQFLAMAQRFIENRE
jgi:uncharacterized protein (UPF0332 family)